MRRTPIIGLAVLSLVALGASPGAADTDTTSPTSSSSSSSAAPDGSSGVEDPEKIDPYVSPSVVFLVTLWDARIYDTDFDEFVRAKTFVTGSRCTGFVVNPDGYIGTAGHCVRYDEDIKFQLLSDAVDWTFDTDYWQAGTSRDAVIEHAAKYWKLVDDDDDFVSKPTEHVTASWEATVSGIDVSDGKPAQVIASQKLFAGDSALLKVDSTGLNALPLGNVEEQSTGTSIACIGFPGNVDTVTVPDYKPSVKTGSISSYSTVAGGLVSVYEIDANISGGMSGGPTTNLAGEVIGVNSFTPYEDESGFTFVQSVDRMKELMGGAGVPNEVDPITTQYREGIDAYFSGDKDTAITDLQAVVDIQPANGTAQDYLTKAKDLPDIETESTDTTDDSSGGVPIWVWLLLAVVVLGAAAAAVLMMRKRQQPAPAEATAWQAQGYPKYQPTIQGSTEPSDDPRVFHMPAGASAVESEDGPGHFDAGGARQQEHDEQDDRPTAVQPRFCGNCGNQVAEGMKFCGSCGHPMG
jgi:S1-C subfamily serine protease